MRSLSISKPFPAKPLLCLVFVCGVKSASIGQIVQALPTSGVQMPSSSHPFDARKTKFTGFGTCQVAFDASGHVVSAVMTKSTGYKALDDKAISFAIHGWTGKPSTTVSVPIAYKVASSSNPLDASQVIYTPVPPYPLQSRQMREHGRGTVKVTFDEQGHPVSAVMLQSTYSNRLDSNTVNYALKAWYAPKGKSRTIEVPVDYELR